MIVKSMLSSKGNFIPNQFEIVDDNSTYFQSYKSMIAKKNILNGDIELDSTYWNYSRTTSKYLSIFLNEPIKDIKRKVKEGIYTLANLN